MILYRTQSFPESTTWANEYHATLAEGRAALAKAKRDGIPARLDRMDIPVDKHSLVDFLNHMNQPGELMERNY